MAARRRDARKRNWPPNLYESKGYYSWRNPEDGCTYGLGRDTRAAFEQAVEANLHIAGLSTKARLVDRISGDADRTWANWLNRYETILEKRDLADNTRRTYKSLLKRARTTFEEKDAAARITTAMVADALRAISEEGKARTAQQFRSFMADVFREAIAAGWVTTSPVEVTKTGKVTIKRSRLSFAVFKQLYSSTKNIWLKNTMALALVTAQRREDIAVAKYSDFRDGGWWCEQIKTGTRVFLPMALRLDAFGLSLEDVIKQCLATQIISKHPIHQVRRHGNSPVGSPMWKDTISRTFSSELAKLKLEFANKEPPTFHEIRSLAERMYHDQGNIETQALLGHKDARTTQLYHDVRGAEWVQVKIGTA